MNKKSILSILCFLGLIVFFDSCSKQEDAVPETTASSNKFAGEWYLSENSSLYGNSTYKLKVTDSTNTTYIFFEYLYGFHTKVKAITSGNSISIPSQIIEGNDVSGSGSLVNSTRISLTYYVNSGLTKETLTAVLTK
jgi:hypothetical protein